MKKKLLIPIMVLILLIGAVGGTLAWLTDKTDTITNTFTVGDINIDLTESEDLDLKMIPGKTLKKDPVVTVEGGSEACWLFVKVDESTNLDTFITYAVDDEWTPLTGVAGVYYREVATSAVDQKFNVLANDQVTVNGEVTKAMLDALNIAGAEQPTLTFTAYAVQSEALADVDNDKDVDANDAWAVASK